MKKNKRDKRIQIEIDDNDLYHYDDQGRSLSEIRGDDLLDLLKRFGLKSVRHAEIPYYEWIKVLCRY